MFVTDCEKMATVSQVAFAACKIHENNDKRAALMREEKDRIGNFCSLYLCRFNFHLKDTTSI